MAEKVTLGFVEALSKVQAEMPVMPKNTTNPFFKSKYASLDDITEIVFPIITKYGFAWITLPGIADSGEPTLIYRLYHTSDKEAVIWGEMKLLLKNSDPQGQGSGITYARRYALMSVLGLVAGEDDDGNARSRFKPKTTEETPENPTKKPQDVDTETGEIKELKGAITDQQAQTLKGMMVARGIKTAGDAKLAFKIWANADVDSVTSLTKAQASLMIGTLKQMTLDQTQGDLLKNYDEEPF